MRIVILTNQKPHHQFLCGYISERHNVVGILHPKPQSAGRRRRMAAMRRAYGGLYALLRTGVKLPGRISGWDSVAENGAAEHSYFPDAAQSYAKIDDARKFPGVDVDSDAARQIVTDLSPDVVINLGGAIYRKDFIQCCGLFLNYHSGISPIYNGAGTVNYAFANGHPHLCGGTLMTMSPVIDGGAVLAHYFPEIEADDTPATLSMKTYAGAAILYDRFLTGLRVGASYSETPQHRPMFYVKGAHWTLYQTLMTRYLLRRKLPEQYLRDEKIVEYWAQADNAQAEDLFTRTLTGLLWGAR